jgi:hypothetical protein
MLMVRPVLLGLVITGLGCDIMPPFFQSFKEALRHHLMFLVSSLHSSPSPAATAINVLLDVHVFSSTEGGAWRHKDFDSFRSRNMTVHLDGETSWACCWCSSMMCHFKPIPIPSVFFIHFLFEKNQNILKKIFHIIQFEYSSSAVGFVSFLSAKNLKRKHMTHTHTYTHSQAMQKRLGLFSCVRTC